MSFVRVEWHRLQSVIPVVRSQTEVCATLLQTSASHGDLTRSRIVSAVIDQIAVFIDEFQLDLVLAANPATQPDRIPLVDEFRFATVYPSFVVVGLEASPPPFTMKSTI